MDEISGSTVADQSHRRRFVLHDRRETRHEWICENIVVGIVVGRGDFADNGVRLRGPETVIDPGGQRDAFSGGEREGLARDYRRPFARALDTKRCANSAGGGRLSPELHHQFTAPTDDVLLLLQVGVRRNRLARAHVDQLLAVLRLIGEVNQHKTAAGEVAASTIGHVPVRLWRERPAGALKNGESFPVSGIDGGAFHGGKKSLQIDSCRLEKPMPMSGVNLEPAPAGTLQSAVERDRRIPPFHRGRRGTATPPYKARVMCAPSETWTDVVKRLRDHAQQSKLSTVRPSPPSGQRHDEYQSLDRNCSRQLAAGCRHLGGGCAAGDSSLAGRRTRLRRQDRGGANAFESGRRAYPVRHSPSIAHRVFAAEERGHGGGGGDLPRRLSLIHI